MAAPSPDDFPKLTIDFQRGDSDDPHCTALPDKLYAQFMTPHPKIKGRGRYEVGCSILVLPKTYDEYWGHVGYYTRRKVRKAEKEGYVFERIDRNKYLDDIFAINTSADERQGRPMTEAYRRKVEPYPPLPEYSCPQHQYRTYGVLREGHLYAYIWVYQVGELWWLSTLLGHAEHLSNGIMFLLMTGAIQDLMEASRVKYAMYTEHLSGSDGLRFFKEQLGFQPYTVRWMRGPQEV